MRDYDIIKLIDIYKTLMSLRMALPFRRVNSDSTEYSAEGY